MGQALAKREEVDGGSPFPVGTVYRYSGDVRIVRRLIAEQRTLSPCYVGTAEATRHATVECPICFLYYPPNINLSRCCGQPICTECFLQITHPPTGGPAICPYCNQEEYGVVYVAPGTPKMSHAKFPYPSTAPNIVTVDMIRPNSRKPTKPTEEPYAPIRRMTISGPGMRSDAHRQHRSVSTNNVSTSYNVSHHRDDTGASPSVDVETQIEQLMIMEAIRLSLIDREQQQRQQQQQQQEGNSSNANPSLQDSDGSISSPPSSSSSSSPSPSPPTSSRSYQPQQDEDDDIDSD